MKETLKNLGFTDNEAKIYLTLLNLGPSPAGKITEKSGIHRRSVYDAIDRLTEKGAVGYMKTNNVKVYEATNPQVLLDIATKTRDDITEVLPQLEGLFNQTKEKKETLFFRGKNGVRNIFVDQINEGEEVLIIGASKNAYEVLKYYLPHYERERTKKKIKVRLLIDKAEEKLKVPLSQVKYLPDEFSGPTATNIYADKVALIIWIENPYAILIKDKDVADSYKKHFEFMWKNAKD
ncbi:hypothetical protein GOV05_02480 [Candidatus Woesearchaeota archaeon]|nr:hypothetical protein [Candidatus Woesearchaeota archaeon]